MLYVRFVSKYYAHKTSRCSIKLAPTVGKAYALESICV